MDFRYLMEKGDYKREELRTEQEKFVAGMEWVKDWLLDSLETDYKLMLDDAEAGILEKIQAEERLGVLAEVREYIDIEMCKAIVCFLDENACEETDGEEAGEEAGKEAGGEDGEGADDKDPDR